MSAPDTVAMRNLADKDTEILRGLFRCAGIDVEVKRTNASKVQITVWDHVAAEQIATLLDGAP